MPRKIPKSMVAITIAIAQQVLANEQVRRRLAEAPGQVIDWAAAQRAQWRAGPATRLDPRSRFGQRALERRVDALAAVVERAFPGRDTRGRAEVEHALDGIRAALTVAAPMPIRQRRAAQRRIDGQLRTLEAAVVDAVLPPST